MTDILSMRVGETIRSAGMVKKGNGDAITAGTCNYYLLRDSDGEYWNDAAGEAGEWTTDQTKTGNPMTHRGDGLWTVELRSSPFAAGVVYVEWAEESGGLHVPAEGRLLRGVVASVPQTGDSFPIVNHADYGNAKLVRSETPANAVAVDGDGKVAVPDTQKVEANVKQVDDEDVRLGAVGVVGLKRKT
jgi:hypothetical protein